MICIKCGRDILDKIFMCCKSDNDEEEYFHVSCPPKLEIEIGKFYKTVAGLKARIYALDGIGESIHGAVYGDSGWRVTSWDAKGIKDKDYGYYNIVGLWDGE